VLLVTAPNAVEKPGVLEVRGGGTRRIYSAQREGDTTFLVTFGAPGEYTMILLVDTSPPDEPGERWEVIAEKTVAVL
jgi:hypothetical protein